MNAEEVNMTGEIKKRIGGTSVPVTCCGVHSAFQENIKAMNSIILYSANTGLNMELKRSYHGAEKAVAPNLFHPGSEGSNNQYAVNIADRCVI